MSTGAGFPDWMEVPTVVAGPEGALAKALLVDDRRDNLIALEAILQGLPVEPVAVESGAAALKQLLIDDFAVILLDAQMPDMDGFETASHIKHRERTRHVPIIFLTAVDGATALLRSGTHADTKRALELLEQARP